MAGVLSPELCEEVYKGVWHGRPVQFNRVFRGYRFSDDECEALCRGESLEVHGLERKGVRYSVLGALQESSFEGHALTFSSVRFKSEHTIPYNPEYKFVSKAAQYDVPNAGEKEPEELDLDAYAEEVLFDKHAAQADGSSASADEDFINQFDPAHPDGEAGMLNAQLEAMINAPYALPFVKVEDNMERVHFVPVLELLSEEVLLKAAQDVLSKTETDTPKKVTLVTPVNMTADNFG